MKAILLTALSTLSICAATIIVEWDTPATADADYKYRIYTQQGTNAPVRVAEVSHPTNTVSFELIPGEYEIIGRSVNVWGESVDSNRIKLPPPPGPPSLRTYRIITVMVEDKEKFLVTVTKE